MPSTRRRALELAAGTAAASLAGCLGSGTCVDWSGGPGFRSAYGLDLRTATDETVVETADRGPAELHPLARTLVRAAARANGATYHGARWKPALTDAGPQSYWNPTNSFVRIDGDYHRVRFDRLAEAEVTSYRIRASTDAQVNAAAQSAEPVRVEELPTQDHRTVLARLGHAADRPQREVGDFRALWGVGYLDDALLASSALVPDPEHGYLRHRDWYVRLERLDAGTATLRDYRVRLEQVEGSTSEVASAIRRTDGTRLAPSEMSAGERELVETAIDGRYEACGDASTTFRTLRKRLGGARYVRYEGTWYAVDWLS